MGQRKIITFFLPGIGGYAAFHAPLVARIGEYGKVIAMEYGRCDTSEQLGEAYALRQADLIDRAADTHPNATIFLVACSYGGTHALRIIPRLTVARVHVLLVSPALFDLSLPTSLRGIAYLLCRLGAAIVPRIVFGWSAFTLDGTVLARDRAQLYRDGEREARRQLRFRAEDFAHFVVGACAGDLLPSLRARSLTVMGGAGDPLYRMSRSVFRFIDRRCLPFSEMTLAGSHLLNLVGSPALFSAIDSIYAAWTEKDAR